MKEKQYAVMQNRACEYFPCHGGVPEEEFNCLFCWCPLYTLGCAFPHYRDNYRAVTERFPELAALAAKKEKDNEL